MAGTDSMEPWRELFRGRDIYDVIGNAILIAATDSPKEFRRRRDGIVEQIYTAPASAIAIPATLQGRSSAGGEVSGSALQQVVSVSEKGSKVASCTVAEPTEEPEADEIDDEGAIVADKQRNGYGDNSGHAVSESGIDWLQTLADEMDEEAQEINEVLRIKEILLNHHEQSTDILFDSLRRLQLMHLTADKIKSTEIGRAVAALSKHKLQKIRMLVRETIKGWKAVVDDWIAATKATVDGDSSECYSYKSQDISNQLAAEDGGLAVPPMDVEALFLVSHATAMQNVSEFLHGMDDDGIMTNVITGMDKGGSSGSYNNRKYDGMKPSDTVPRNKDLILVQDLPATQRQPSDKMNPQKLPPRQRSTPSKNTDLTQTKRLNADGNSSLLRQQCQRSDLPARQEPALLQKSNIQKTQEQGSQVPRIRIKIKHSSPGCAPRRGLFEKILEKKPCEENSGTIAVARNPPVVAAARDLPSGQAVVKTGMPTQSSAELNKLGTGRKVQLANMNLDETKRKLHGAYQEAENAKKKRAIQVVKPCDIPKSKDIGRTPLTTSTNPVRAGRPL
ncbi:unnamed protein product [Urochloa decumbens]|uniref:TFIIS N-terminal domain-containing protein n=1 Tax=Urochloa decumbens TaxID=240449 RepID=A0ABC8ZQH8_9POAL